MTIRATRCWAALIVFVGQALRLEGHVVVCDLAIASSGFAGSSRFAAGCTSATSFHSREELNVAGVDVHGQAGFPIAAFPQVRVDAALEVDGVALLEVRGYRFRGVAEDVRLEPELLLGSVFA